MGPTNQAKSAGVNAGSINGGMIPSLSWKKMALDQKVELLLRVVQEQRRIIERAGKTINKLTRHKHDERGYPSLEVSIMESIHDNIEEKMYSVLDEIDFS